MSYFLCGSYITTFKDNTVTRPQFWQLSGDLLQKLGGGGTYPILHGLKLKYNIIDSFGQRLVSNLAEVK